MPSPVRLPIPGADLRSILGQALDGRWKNFEDRALKVGRRPTEKAVHDLRVALRRLIAMLDLVSDAVPDSPIARLRKQLKRHLDAYSALRDNQVQILLTRGLIAGFPALKLFLTMLMVREKRLLKSARAEITPARLSTLEAQRATISPAMGIVLDDPALAEAVPRILSGVIARSFARAVSLQRSAMNGNTGNIHRFRLSFKKFRYAVEALLPLHPGAPQELPNAMSRYQARMGAIQDLEILESGIRSFIRRHRRLAPDQFALLEEHLSNRRKEAVQAFIASADELPYFWQSLQQREHGGA